MNVVSSFTFEVRFWSKYTIFPFLNIFRSCFEVNTSLTTLVEIEAECWQLAFKGLMSRSMRQSITKVVLVPVSKTIKDDVHAPLVSTAIITVPCCTANS